MAIISEKLVGGSYYNSTTEVSFLPEKKKLCLCHKRTTHSQKAKYLVWYSHGHCH